MKPLVMLFAAAALTGCAGIKPSLPYKAYQDTETPVERTALIVAERTPLVSYSLEGYEQQITCIDGHSTEAILTYEDQSRFATQVRVLPGRHYVRVKYEHRLSFSNVLLAWANLWFDAEAGHEYRVRRELDTGSTVVVSIVDATTSRSVGGVTGSDPDRSPDAKTCE